jgi:hypothetical protein
VAKGKTNGKQNKGNGPKYWVQGMVGL